MNRTIEWHGLYFYPFLYYQKYHFILTDISICNISLKSQENATVKRKQILYMSFHTKWNLLDPSNKKQEDSTDNLTIIF